VTSTPVTSATAASRLTSRMRGRGTVRTNGKDRADRPRPPPPPCAERVTVHDPTSEALTYRLTIDLHGCGWWDSSPPSLVAFLTTRRRRDGGERP
jgi:hypothetical protein